MSLLLGEQKHNTNNTGRVGLFCRELVTAQVDCPGSLKIGWRGLDWRMLAGRSVFHRTRTADNKRNLSIKYADQCWTGFRSLLFTLTFVGYMRRELTLPPFTDRFEYLTSVTALLSVIYCSLTLLFQFIAFFTLKTDKLLYSDMNWCHESVIVSTGRGWTQRRWMRNVANLKQIMGIILVPMNLVVIVIYWKLVFPTATDHNGNPAKVTFNSLMSHLIGGTVILVDWCLENSWFFFFNGWPLFFYSVSYSIFITCWTVAGRPVIYPTINPTKEGGIIFIILLNFVVMPILLGMMTAAKSYRTVKLLRRSKYSVRSIESDLPVSYATSN